MGALIGPEGDRFKLEEAQNAEALLLGRVTYEAMQAFWPTAEGEFADRLNELPKYVVSSTLTDPHWNATALGDDWPKEVARLRKELDGEIVVYGSRRLSRARGGGGSVRAGLPWQHRNPGSATNPACASPSRLVVSCTRHHQQPA